MMESAAELPLKTKRLGIGQIMIGSGCCCGAVGRGRPGVLIDWLSQEWRRRGLLKKMRLTFSYCMGPCDLLNMVRISSPSAELWLGNINRAEQDSELVEWAAQSKAEGVLLALPNAFEYLRSTCGRSGQSRIAG